MFHFRIVHNKNTYMVFVLVGRWITLKKYFCSYRIDIDRDGGTDLVLFRY